MKDRWRHATGEQEAGSAVDCMTASGQGGALRGACALFGNLVALYSCMLLMITLCFVPATYDVVQPACPVYLLQLPVAEMGARPGIPVPFLRRAGVSLLVAGAA